MQVLKDNSVDCLIACDVLEHIPDHKKAMEEINRVLRTNGVCILSVPQKDNLEITEEDITLITPELRK